MFSPLLHDAWFQRDHRTNQRPIPVHRWPVSHFRWRLKGKSTPGGSGGLSSTRRLEASAFPLCESWTVTHTKHRAHRKCLWTPRSAVWCAQTLEKPSKPCLQRLLAQGRVWVRCALWVWHPLKRYDNNVPWAGVIMCSAGSGSSCCCDGSECFSELFWDALGLLVIVYTQSVS